MARIRTIKPEFWDSPSTARASLRARLFFIAMWNWADDWGIGTANARQLIGFAFPNDADVTDADFPRLCAEVEDCFDVVFYEASGRPYYAIPSWEAHQRNERRAKSRNPNPDQGKRFTHGTSAPTHGDSGTGTGEQRNRGTEEPGTKTLAHPRSETEPNRFDEFWDTYSHKVGRKKAEAAYRAAVRKPSVTDDLLIAAAAAYITWQMSEGKHPTFTKHPATWLTGEHWRDERPAHRPAQATRMQEHLSLVQQLQAEEQQATTAEIGYRQ
jgi:hypothetical protein